MTAMRKIRRWISVAAIGAAVTTIWLQHEQNRQLIQELDLVRQENTRLGSTSSTSASEIQTASETSKSDEMESELLRLRGVAARAAQNEAEIHQLRRELAQLRGQKGAGDSLAAQSSDTLSTYLGSPVASPADIDPRYTKEGLSAAVQLAAQNAGISLRKVSIDDSEYPFLIGVVTDPGDWAKLTAQIKTLDGYDFHGSVGNETAHTLCPVPVRAYPAEAAQTITRRMNTRLELFYNTFTAQQN